MNVVQIGYDRKEDVAYHVAKYSIERHSPNTLVFPLIQDLLRAVGSYKRPPDTKASTDFSLTRFIVPVENTGWQFFCDCDFLFTADLNELFALADPKYAVMCVKHEYEPRKALKMGGKQQHVYPRKNWSSATLWNCDHPSNKKLTTAEVNHAPPAWLHRFGWLDDEEIGDIPREWNWLVGEERWLEDDPPKGIHFTLGLPNLKGYEHCQFANLWRAELAAMEKNEHLRHLV